MDLALDSDLSDNEGVFALPVDGGGEEGVAITFTVDSEDTEEGDSITLSSV